MKDLPEGILLRMTGSDGLNRRRPFLAWRNGSK
jgi:hypothetical protein